MNNYFDILDEPLAVSQPGQKKSLAMAYVEMQGSVEPMYDEDKALEQGTLYKNLDMPFLAGGNQK